jgi:hypothetical protein
MAGGVDASERIRGVPNQTRGARRVEWAVAKRVEERLAGDPLADDVGPRPFVDGVVDPDHRRVHDASRRDRLSDHLLGRRATWNPQLDRDSAIQQVVGTSPDGMTGRSVGVQSLFQPVPASQHLTLNGCADLCHNPPSRSIDRSAPQGRPYRGYWGRVHPACSGASDATG